MRFAFRGQEKDGSAVKRANDVIIRTYKKVTEFRNLEAYAFCLTVDTIRKAKGKPDPKDLPEGTLERRLAEIDEINDTLRMLGIDPTDLNAPPSASSTPSTDPLP